MAAVTKSRWPAMRNVLAAPSMSAGGSPATAQPAQRNPALKQHELVCPLDI